jgi:excisionase family DNA binding protein
MDDFMTIRELAEMYRVSEKTIRRWISSGHLDAERLPGGRLIRIDIANLERLTQPISFRSNHLKRGQSNFLTLGEMLNSNKGPIFKIVDMGGADGHGSLPYEGPDLNFNDSREKYGFEPVEFVEHISKVSILPQPSMICFCGHPQAFHVSRECRGPVKGKCNCTTFKLLYEVNDFRFFLQDVAGYSNLHPLKKGLAKYSRSGAKRPLFASSQVCFECKKVIDYWDDNFVAMHIHHKTRSIDPSLRGQSRLFHYGCGMMYNFHHGPLVDVPVGVINADWVQYFSANTPNK